MSNKVKYIDIKNKYIDMKNRTYYIFDDIINIKIFDPDNIKIDKNSYKNILIYTGYVTIKDLKDVTLIE